MNKKNMKRSPLFYVGDKYKILEQIKPLFPININRFFEPFTGGGSVFLNVETNEYYINDIDSNLQNIHKYLISESKNIKVFYKKIEQIINNHGLSKSYLEDVIPTELKKLNKKTYYAKFNKDGYLDLRSDYNNSKIKDPLKLYLLLIYGFNRMLRFNRSGKFNLPVGNVDFNKNVVNALNEYFLFVKDRNITIHNLDFKDFLEKYKYDNNDFIYFDPPYLITFSEYNKLWNETDELRLLEMLDNLNKYDIKFALSNVTHYKGKKNSLLINWMKQYNTYEIKSNYINYHNNSKKFIREVLITNYTK